MSNSDKLNEIRLVQISENFQDGFYESDDVVYGGSIIFKVSGKQRLFQSLPVGELVYIKITLNDSMPNRWVSSWKEAGDMTNRVNSDHLEKIAIDKLYFEKFGVRPRVYCARY